MERTENDREPLVSVVTPVYNTGEYLEDAIRSVLAQSHQNWEYIICDNHSTDATAGVAARFAAIDQRIRIVSPPTFLSQPKNFNHALSHISPDSRYTKIVLADDWMYPECLAQMVAVAERDHDVVMVGAYRLEGTEVKNCGLEVDATVVPGRFVARMHLLEHKFVFGTPSSVLYRSQAVRRRLPEFFPEDRYYFDTDVAMQLVRDASFGFVHQVLTYSRMQEESITHRERNYYSLQVDRLTCLAWYGRDYLDAAEYEQCMSWIHSVYYESLAREWLRERFGRAIAGFWEYQRSHLAPAGLTLERRSLAIGVVRVILRMLGSPLDVARQIVNGRRTPPPWRQ